VYLESRFCRTMKTLVSS